MNSRNIEGTINEIQERKDRNGNDYLLLKFTKEESGDDDVIFVFSSQVEEGRWENLQENGKYNFTVEEGNNGSNILKDFEIA